MAHLEWNDDAGHIVAVRFDAVRTVEHRQNATVTKHPIQGGADIADHVRVELPGVSVTGYVSRAPLTGLAKLDTLDGVPGRSGRYETVELPGSGVSSKGLVSKRVELPPPPPSPVARSATAALQGGLLQAGLDAISSAFGANSVDALVPGPAGITSPNKVETLVTDEADARVSAMHTLLTEAQQAKRLVRFVDQAATYEDMIITGITVSRDQQMFGAAFQVELEQIKFASSQTLDVPVPREPRGQTVKNAGASSAKSGGDTVDGKRKDKLKSDAAGLFDGAVSGLKGLLGS